MRNREVLERRFTKKEVKTRPGPSGEELHYVETASVIQRLNEAFDGDWSFEIREKAIDLENGYIWVLGRIQCEGVVKEQFGFKNITFDASGKPLDLGFDLKAAASDALKKCATLLGVGLYLYQEEEEHGEQVARLATEKQKAFIRDLLRAQGKKMDETRIAQLTSQEASVLIDKLRAEGSASQIKKKEKEGDK